MSRLAIVDHTKLNLSEVTVLLQGGSNLELDVLVQIFVGFGSRQFRRAESPQQAREVIEAEPVDLLVIDAAGGLDDILRVVHDLRRMTTASRYAPVVLTTANVTSSMMHQACDAGVSYLVTKPLAPRVLFERMAWIVKDARPFIECESYVGPDRRVRALGPPTGMTGRRAGDLSAEVGAAATPNMSQSDIDAMMAPVRKSL